MTPTPPLITSFAARSMRNPGLCGTALFGCAGCLPGRGSLGSPPRVVLHNRGWLTDAPVFRHGAWERRSAMSSWTKVKVAGVQPTTALFTDDPARNT
jgi:hypothetical protein